MSKKASCILVLLIFLSLLSAQTEQDSARVFKTHSIQFQIRDCFRLSSFKGGLISYKYHFNDRNALRLGFNNDSRIWEENKDYDLFLEDTTYNEEQTSYSNVDFLMNLEYLRYINPGEEIKIILGGGLKTTLDKDKDEVNEKSPTDQFYDKYRKYSLLKIGVTSSYGLEWKFKNNMSLHAEYGFDILWSHYKTSRYRTKTTADGEEHYSDDTKKSQALSSTVPEYYWGYQYIFKKRRLA